MGGSDALTIVYDVYLFSGSGMNWRLLLFVCLLDQWQWLVVQFYNLNKKPNHWTWSTMMCLKWMNYSCDCLYRNLNEVLDQMTTFVYVRQIVLDILFFLLILNRNRCLIEIGHSVSRSESECEKKHQKN